MSVVITGMLFWIKLITFSVLLSSDRSVYPVTLYLVEIYLYNNDLKFYQLRGKYFTSNFI